MYRLVSTLLFLIFFVIGLPNVSAQDTGNVFMGVDLDSIDPEPAAFPSGYYLENIHPGSSFVLPVATAFTPDGRVLVAEKRGIVWVIENGQKLSEPFIDLRDEVMSHHDRGLLGMTLHPEFESNGYVYLLYTVDHDGSGSYQRTDAFSRLTRYTADTNNPNRANLSSRHILVGETFSTGWPACYYSHVIGTVQFGNDGSLLVGSGDAASYNHTDAGGLYNNCFGPDRIDPVENIGAFRSIYNQSLAGKIIRIDPETGLGLPSNPYYTGDASDTESKIWVSGLRNPFRFSVGPDGNDDPALGQPGTLYIGDVGWGTWEDLNVAVGGENFGWPCFEGPNAHNGYQNANPAHSGCDTLPASEHTPPEHYFHHQNGNHSSPAGLRGFSILAGDMYEGARYPEDMHGKVFYGDYVAGWIAYATPDGPGSISQSHTVLSTTAGTVVDIRYNPYDQLLYFVNIGSGGVFAFRHVNDTDNVIPVPLASATPLQGEAPLEVQFTGDTSFDPLGSPLTYEWDFGDGNFSTEANPLHVYTSRGLYTASLTVTNSLNNSASTSVEINVAGAPPTALIETPEIGTWASVGEEVLLSGTGSSSEYPFEQLTFHWNVTQVHNEHDHPNIVDQAGTEASFVVPAHGMRQEVEYYHILFTVTDPDGLTGTAETHLLVNRSRTTDMTSAGTPIALITDPTGIGNPDIGIIANGIFPEVGTDDPMMQFDTERSGEYRDEDWIGYEFDREWTFGHVVFQDGLVREGGGFFEDLTLQVRQNGTWIEPDYVTVIEPYENAEGESFQTYVIVFYATTGDAIRIIGTPGGDRSFISVANLRPHVLLPEADAPMPWASVDIGYSQFPGWTGYEDGIFAVAGRGDAWGDADRLHYTFQTLTGDGAITAKIHSTVGENDWAKTGLMIRGGVSRPDAHASLWVTPGQGTHLQARVSPGGGTSGYGSAGSVSAPTWIRLVRQDNNISGYVSDDGERWTGIGSVVLDLEETALIGLAATATDYDGRNDHAIAVFSDVEVGDVPDELLPEGWISHDIGFVREPGEASYFDDTFTIRGAGDIWGDRDGFHYAYREWSENGTVTVRVDSISAQNPWAKGGLMIRSNAQPNSAHVSLFATPGHGVNLQYRAENGAGSVQDAGRNLSAPAWLRLQRNESTITAFVSEDGAAWILLGQISVDLPETVLLGLALTATDYVASNDLAYMAASDFQLSDEVNPGDGSLPEPWLSTDIGPVAVVGSTNYDSGTFTLEGAGDAWGDADRLHYTFQEIGPEATLTAYVESVSGFNPWSKGGLMIRGSMDRGSAHASIWATAGTGTHLQYRTETDGGSHSIGNHQLQWPLWIRIQRDGDLVAAYVSEDGTEWDHLASAIIDLPEIAFIGMGVTPTDYSGRNDTAILRINSLMFDDVVGHLVLPEDETPTEPFGIASIYPNPMFGDGTVVLNIEQPGEHRFELYDLLGRRVWTAARREESTGQMRFPIQTHNLTSGVYVFRGISPTGEQQVRRLTVAR